MPKYHSIEAIPAKVFFEVLHTKNYQLLRPKPNETGLDAVFTAIYDDFFVKSDNENSKEFLRLKNNIVFLSYKIETIKQVVRFLFFNKTTKEMRMELIDALNSIGVYVDKENDFTDEIQRVLQVEIGTLENDLNFDKMGLESLQSQASEKVFDFYESLISLESVHERNLDDEMSLAKYIQYEKMATKKLKAQKQQQLKTA